MTTKPKCVRASELIVTLTLGLMKDVSVALHGSYQSAADVYVQFVKDYCNGMEEIYGRKLNVQALKDKLLKRMNVLVDDTVKLYRETNGTAIENIVEFQDRLKKLTDDFIECCMSDFEKLQNCELPRLC